MPSDDDTIDTGRILAGAAIGLLAGLAASFAMDRFQAAVTALSSDDDDDSEPATDQAADAIVRAVRGVGLAKDEKPLGGHIVHYALGGALGAAYGAAAVAQPKVTVGFGAAFGLGTAAVLDEAAVPAAGLGDAPWETPPATHLYTVASHVVFGAVTEGVRRLLTRWFLPR